MLHVNWLVLAHNQFTKYDVELSIEIRPFSIEIRPLSIEISPFPVQFSPAC